MTEDILDRYPAARGNARAMAMLCMLAHKKGLHEDAMALGVAAMACAPEDMVVRDLVRSALSSGIPPFHVPMLKDQLCK